MKRACRQRGVQHVGLCGALRREGTARHQAGGSEHASLPGANLIEQDLTSGLRSLEHPRLAFDAHHVSPALLALAISNVALTEPIELSGTEQLRTMRFIELRQIGTARKAQKRGARARPVDIDMVWEQAPKKLSKCRYAPATIAAEKPDNQGLGCLTEPRQSPLLPLSAGRMAASPQILRVRRRGKSGLQGSTVPDNLRRG